MTVDNEYSLVEFNDEQAIISISGTSKTLEQEEFQDVNGMPAKYNMKGIMMATIKVSSKTGWVEEGTIRQEFTGDLEIADNPQVPGGMNIPMEMVSDTEISNK